MPPAPGAPARNNRVGAALLLTAGGIYLYTMRHLKATAPGDLSEMQPLPPSAGAADAAARSKA